MTVAFMNGKPTNIGDQVNKDYPSIHLGLPAYDTEYTISVSKEYFVPCDVKQFTNDDTFFENLHKVIFQLFAQVGTIVIDEDLTFMYSEALDLYIVKVRMNLKNTHTRYYPLKYKGEWIDNKLMRDTLKRVE